MIVHKLTKEESDSLKNAPRVGFFRFCDKIGNATNWYDMTLRLQVGNVLVANTSNRYDFSQEIPEILRSALEASDAMRERAINTTPQTWSASDKELSQLSEGLDIVDSLQDYCTRLELLKAHRLAQKLVRT